jgi:3-oxoadipate enol-lactonase
MPMITMPDGARISAHVEGPHDRPWLVLSNSILSSHKIWERQIAAIAQQYRVLRYDARGHGDSDASAPPYSMRNLVDDAVTLMNHFRIPHATFMGISLGGMTGLGLALAHPDRLAALVCCCARADAPTPFVQSWDDRIAIVRDRGLAAIVPGTIERWLSAPFRASEPDAVREVERMIMTTSAFGFEGCGEALKGLDYLSRLEHIRIPVLFVCGSEDTGASPATMRDMAARTPNAEFAIVEGSAHLPNIDNDRGFHEAVRDFLRLS